MTSMVKVNTITKNKDISSRPIKTTTSSSKIMITASIRVTINNKLMIKISSGITEQAFELNKFKFKNYYRNMSSNKLATELYVWGSDQMGQLGLGHRYTHKNHD